MLRIYALKNTKVPFWNAPTFSPSDKEETKVGLYRHCKLNQKQTKQEHFDECELYYLGEFDDVKGKMRLLDEPEFLLDLKECYDNE